MASKGVLLNAFFEQFTSFLTQLTEMYPDDPDFAMFLTTIRLMKTTNPSLVVKHVNDNVSQYEEQIMSKDEKFFLEHTFDYVADLDMDILAKLKQYVASMSPDSKESVWKYCQNIVRLAKACQTA